MTNKRIDGKAIAREIQDETAAAAAELALEIGRPPKIATILVGDDPASAVYVAAKHKACGLAGIASDDRRLTGGVSLDALGSVVDELSSDDEVDGILLQLPLPDGQDPSSIIERIDPRKDVDGLTVSNVGKLWRRGEEGLAPCTPSGVIELLDRSDIEIAGRETVIIGRSELVGKPLGALLLARDATVTFAHSRSRDLPTICRRADLLIAAAGVPKLVTADHVKRGAVVIDVGINRVDGKLIGDVDFQAVESLAGAITPVPGGVGPMTIACLLANTLRAAQRAL